jgi:hypothetical protein
VTLRRKRRRALMTPADMVAGRYDHRRAKRGGRSVRILGRARTRCKVGSVENYDRPMRADLSPLQRLFVSLAGLFNRRQQLVIDYLVEENRVLKGNARERARELAD